MTERLAEIQRALDSFRMDEARALAQQELDENPSAAAYYLASQAALTQGERLNYLRQALEIDPDFQPAAIELGLSKPKEKPKPEPIGRVGLAAGGGSAGASIGDYWQALAGDHY